MFRRVLIIVVVVLLVAIALMISRSAMVPVEQPAQSQPPMDSDEKQPR